MSDRSSGRPNPETPAGKTDQQQDELFDKDFLTESDRDFLAELDRVLAADMPPLAEPPSPPPAPGLTRTAPIPAELDSQPEYQAPPARQELPPLNLGEDDAIDELDIHLAPPQELDWDAPPKEDWNLDAPQDHAGPISEPPEDGGPQINLGRRRRYGPGQHFPRRHRPSGQRPLAEDWRAHCRPRRTTTWWTRIPARPRRPAANRWRCPQYRPRSRRPRQHPARANAWVWLG